MIVKGAQTVGIGGGSGFTLGALQNVFAGADRAAAESARDVYAGANPTWVTGYNDDTNLNIRLEYSDGVDQLALYQVRNATGTAWLDNSSAIAIKGDTGAPGATGNSYFFASIAARDTFFGTPPNQTLLETELPITVNVGNETTSQFVWSGATAPASYDSALWRLAASEVSSGTLYLGQSGASISSGNETLNFITAGGVSHYLHGIQYTDAGSVSPSYWILDPIVPFPLSNISDTVLAKPIEFTLTNTTSGYLRSYVLIPSEVGELRVQTWLGTDDTGANLADVTLTVAAGDVGNETSFAAPNDTLVLVGQTTHTRFSGVKLKGGIQTAGSFVGAIDSVTDSVGIARFTSTASVNADVGSTVAIAGLTNYANGSYVITATGANYFEISSIAFNGTDTGTFALTTIFMKLNVLPATEVSYITEDKNGNVAINGSLQYNAAMPEPSYVAGQAWYDSSSKGHVLDTGYTGVRLNVGRESHIEVYNGTASQINNGDPVSVTGVITGVTPNVVPMNSSSILLALGFAGVATMNIPAGTVGVATNFGKVNGVNTGSLSVGFVYAGIAGGYTQTRPLYPEQRFLIGGVTKTGVLDGVISVSAQLIPRRSASTSYSFTSSGVGAGVFYKGGFYDWAAASTALTQSSLTQTHGIVGMAYGAHAGIVPSAAGAVDTGQVGLRVTGVKDSELGAQVAGQTDIVTDDITTLTANAMAETVGKFSGQVTYELYVVSGAPTAYNLTFNYGYSKYEDMQNQDVTITSLECIWQGNSTDAGFDIALKHHTPLGWTYAATGFSPGNADVARKSVDQALAGSVVNGESGSWKRVGLNSFIDGNSNDGVLFEITTTQNNTIQTMDLHIAGFSEEL